MGEHRPEADDVDTTVLLHVMAAVRLPTDYIDSDDMGPIYREILPTLAEVEARDPGVSFIPPGHFAHIADTRGHVTVTCSIVHDLREGDPRQTIARLHAALDLHGAVEVIEADTDRHQVRLAFMRAWRKWADHHTMMARLRREAAERD